MASDSVTISRDQIRAAVRIAVKELVMEAIGRDYVAAEVEDACGEVARSLVDKAAIERAVKKQTPAAVKKAVLDAAATIAAREVRETLETHLASAVFTSKAMAKAEQSAFAEVERSKGKIRAAADAALAKRIKEMDNYVRSHVAGIASSWIQERLNDDIEIDTRAVAVEVQREVVAAFRAQANVAAQAAFEQAAEQMKAGVK